AGVEPANKQNQLVELPLDLGEPLSGRFTPGLPTRPGVALAEAGWPGRRPAPWSIAEILESAPRPFIAPPLAAPKFTSPIVTIAVPVPATPRVLGVCRRVFAAFPFRSILISLVVVFAAFIDHRRRLARLPIFIASFPECAEFLFEFGFDFVNQLFRGFQQSTERSGQGTFVILSLRMGVRRSPGDCQDDSHETSDNPTCKYVHNQLLQTTRHDVRRNNPSPELRLPNGRGGPQIECPFGAEHYATSRQTLLQAALLPTRASCGASKTSSISCMIVGSRNYFESFVAAYVCQRAAGDMGGSGTPLARR